MLLFVFHLQSRDANNLMILIVPAFELFSAFVLVFICCELAGLLSNHFDYIDDTMGQFKWYLFPWKIQQILPIILINAQQPVYLKCFGSIPCDRETFKKVRRNCFLTISKFIENSSKIFQQIFVRGAFSFTRRPIVDFRILWYFVNLESDDNKLCDLNTLAAVPKQQSRNVDSLAIFMNQLDVISVNFKLSFATHILCFN